MATVTLRGAPVHTCGSLPLVGDPCPPFLLTRADLTELSSVDLEGQRVVLNVFPSLDTPTCAASVRAFNARAAEVPNTAVLCISEDLPFAMGRFCGAEGLTRVTPASAFRHPGFGLALGLTLVDSPFRGLLARAVLVLNEDGTVVYTELVPDLAREPDYESALAALTRHHRPAPEDSLEGVE
ncbi:MAG TPA: thiol peroxidase [Holophagaceae bacterium]|nr:thiol peroxidase [Holophagaceae bacterium]